MSEHFKRLHLFNGMLATEEDWNAGESYHHDKARIHNRVMHGAGVVPHFREGLSVRALQPAGMKVVVNPGMAMDPLGNELFIWDPVLLSINLDDYAQGGNPFTGNLFVCLSYDEQPDDFAISEVDSRVHGHKRIVEKANVRISAEGLRSDDIELARIRIDERVVQISDAANALAPRPGEIDTRYVPNVGLSGGRLPAVQQHLLLMSLAAHHKALWNWILDYEMMDANLPRPLLLSSAAHIRSGSLDRATICSVLLGVVVTEQEMCTLIQRKAGDWERVWNSREYVAFTTALDRAQKALATVELGPPSSMDSNLYIREVDRALERFLDIRASLERVTEQLGNLLELGAATGPSYEVLTDSDLRGWSKEFPHRMSIDGKPFVLVDTLEVTSPASEEAHLMRLEVGPNDVVQGTTPATYPDGVRITDTGLSYRRGSVYFQVNNVNPSREMLILRRVEFRELKVEEEVRVDDQPIGVWKIEGDDRVNQWRNVMYFVEGSFLVGPRPRFRLRLMDGSSPSNMYRFWFYQKV